MRAQFSSSTSFRKWSYVVVVGGEESYCDARNDFLLLLSNWVHFSFLFPAAVSFIRSEWPYMLSVPTSSSLYSGCTIYIFSILSSERFSLKKRKEKGPPGKKGRAGTSGDKEGWNPSLQSCSGEGGDEKILFSRRRKLNTVVTFSQKRVKLAIMIYYFKIF